MNGYIKKQSLMDFCDNTASKTIDNNDIARFPVSPVIEIDRVLEIIDKEIAKAETNRDRAGNMARENYYDTMIDGMEVVKNAVKELEDKTDVSSEGL